jgi:hypothetical protein
LMRLTERNFVITAGAKLSQRVASTSALSQCAQPCGDEEISLMISSPEG